MEVPAGLTALLALASESVDLPEDLLLTDTGNTDIVTLVIMPAESCLMGKVEGLLAVVLVCVGTADDHVVDAPAA